MSDFSSIVVIFVVFVLAIGGKELRGDPYLLQYGGRIVNADGIPLEGPVDIKVKFYNSLFATTEIEAQVFSDVGLIDGIFKLTITLPKSAFHDLFSQPEVWIEINDITSGTTYPRQRFSAVPYAFKVPVDGVTIGYDANGELMVKKGLGSAELPEGDPSEGQILKWQSGAWSWADDLTGGASTVESADITDGTITDDDIASSAAISQSKISGLTSALGGKEESIAAGTTSQYFRGDKSWQTLNTTAISEGTNLYHTDARAKAAAVADAVADGITDVAPSQNAVFDALAAKENAITAGTTGQYYRGDKSWQTLNTTAISEGSNLYHTDARAKAAAVGDVITDGVTDVAPSQNAVFDALALKQDSITNSTTLDAGTVTVTQQKGIELKPYNAGAGETSELRFDELAANGSNYVALKAPDQIDGDMTWTLPSGDGTMGQFLATNGSGALSWQSPAGGGDMVSAANLSDVADAGAARANLGLGGLATKSSVSTGDITDGTIADGDISATAAIAQSKISGLSASLSGKEDAVAAGTTSQYYRGDKSWQTLSTDTVSEGANLYHTDARAKAAAVSDAITDGITDIAPSQNAVFDGLALKVNSADLGALASKDEVATGDITDGTIVDDDISATAGIAQSKISGLSASLSGKEDAITAGTTSQYYRGDKSWQTLNTSAVSEGSNLYHTDARAKAAAVSDAITDGVTDIAPSQNAVFDSLALKTNSADLGALASKDEVATGDITDGTIANSDISATAAIDASKVADGTVSNGEFQYLNGVTSSVQTQLDSKLPAANPIFTGVISAPLGTNGAPSYAFTGDLNTGIYSSGADAINIATGGQNRLVVDSAGKLGINITSPTYNVHFEDTYTAETQSNYGLYSKTNLDPAANLTNDAMKHAAINGYMNIPATVTNNIMDAHALRLELVNEGSGSFDDVATIFAKATFDNSSAGDLGAAAILETYQNGANATTINGLTNRVNVALGNQTTVSGAYNTVDINGGTSSWAAGVEGEVISDGGTNAEVSGVLGDVYVNSTVTNNAFGLWGSLSMTAGTNYAAGGSYSYSNITGGSASYLYGSKTSLNLNGGTTSSARGSYTYTYLNSGTHPSVTGGYFYTTLNSSGPTDFVYGIRSSVNANSGTHGYVRGISASLDIDGTSSVSYIQGVRGAVDVLDGSHSYSYGVYADSEVDGGTVTSNFGLYVNADFDSGTLTNNYGIYISSMGGTPSGNEYALYSSGSEKIYFRGNVGINQTNASYPLTVNGQPAANGYTTFTNYSDRRLKRDIKLLPDGALDKIIKLRPSSFYYNEKSGYDKKTQKRKVYGFVAQELKEVFPEMVGEKKINGETYYDANLSALQIHLVKALQEQNEILRQQTAALKKQNQRMARMIEYFCREFEDFPDCHQGQ